MNAHSSLNASVGFKMLTQAVVSLTFVTLGPFVFKLNVQIAQGMYFYHECRFFFFFFLLEF